MAKKGKPAIRRKAISTRTRFTVLQRCNFTCRWCGKKSPDVELEVDHVLPVARGGSNHPSNLVAACVGCNAGKSDIPVHNAAFQGALSVAQYASLSGNYPPDEYFFDMPLDIWFSHGWYEVDPSTIPCFRSLRVNTEAQA